MKKLILKILTKKHKDSAGHCGIYFVDIMRITKKPYKAVLDVLNELRRTKVIKVREGAQGGLIFINKPFKTNNETRILNSNKYAEKTVIEKPKGKYKYKNDNNN